MRRLFTGAIGALLLGGMALSLAVLPAPSATAATSLYAKDFDSNGGIDDLVSGRHAEYLTVKEGCGPDGSKCLEVEYEPSEEGSPRLVGSPMLSGRAQDATLRFRVKFRDDFQFVSGGKLHGLGSLEGSSGCTAIQPDAWSVRVMWRRDGVPEIYTYDQDRKNRCGDGHLASDFRFQPGKWHDLAMYVRVNDAGQSNGEVSLHVDGQRIVQVDDVRLCASCSSDTLVTRFLHSTFYGGNGPEWGPTTSTFASFDDFEVLQGRHTDTSGPGGGTTPPTTVPPTTVDFSVEPTLTDGSVTVDVPVRSGVDRVSQIDLLLDGRFVRSERVEPYQWNGDAYVDGVLNGLPPGTHTLKAVVIDTNGNRTEESTSVSVAPAPGDGEATGPSSCGIGKVDEWSTGFVANDIEVTNIGGTSLTDWRAAVTLGQDVDVTDVWGARVLADEGRTIVFGSDDGGRALSPGESAQFGFKATSIGSPGTVSCK